jgi:hypothetical protein
MPIYHNDGLDDQLATDGSEGFAGEVSLLKPALLEPQDCASLINVDADRSGRLVTRLGTDSYGIPGAGAANPVRGLFYFKAPSTEFLMAAVNGTLYSWDGNAWAAVTFDSGALNAGNAVEFAQLTDALYITDGANAWKWTGTGDALIQASLPDCNYLVSHTGRLFAAGQATTDQITVSTLLDGTAGWGTASNSFRVGGGEGEGITGISPWHNFLLVVFKRNSIYMVDANPATATIAASGTANWTVDTVTRNVGCVAHRSIQQVGADMYFLSEDGVRTLARSANDVQVGVGEPISEPIRPLIERINWAYASKACSAFYANRYFLAVPMDSSTTNNAVLVYNLTTQKWTGYWSGWEPTAFAVTKFSGRAKLTFGQATGTVWEWLKWKAAADISASDYTDDGTVVPTTITLKEYTFGEMLSPKSGYSYELEFYQSEADAVVQMILDQGSTEQSYTGKTYSSNTVLPATLPFILAARGNYRISRDLQQFGQWRGIQPKITTTGGKLSVQGCKLTAFIDTMREEEN